MMFKFASTRLTPLHQFSFPQPIAAFSLLSALFLSCLMAVPAGAHHPFGGDIPSNGLEGFLSGLGHPVIGLDHLAFVIAIGLLAATKQNGFWLPIAFLCTAVVGTSIHLANVNLPAAEALIAISVLLFGIILVLPKQPSLPILVGLGMVAGLFHGYAYGEAIVGAAVAPLVAYLIGFTLIQLLIALGFYFIAKRILHRTEFLGLRSIGFILCGAGAAFLSTVVLG
jgi:urease accessory protein